MASRHLSLGGACVFQTNCAEFRIPVRPDVEPRPHPAKRGRRFGEPATADRAGIHYAGLTYEQVRGFLRPDGRGGEAGWIPQADVTRLTAGLVHPLTGNACNVNVCNKVTGTGTYVSQWETTAYGNVGCSSAHYESYTRQYVGYRICPSQPGSGVYFYVYKKALNYANNDLLCNEWLDARVYGEPCVRIIA